MILYFKIKPNHEEWLGERYFRVDFDLEEAKITQVVVKTGERKKGRANTFGILLIHKLTFLSNYFSTGYVTLTTKNTFNKKFDFVVKALK